MIKSTLLYLFTLLQFTLFSAIVPTCSYNDAQIKTVLGSDPTLVIADGTKVNIDGTWDFTSGVNTSLIIELNGRGSLVFDGNGVSRSQVLMLSTQGVRINNTSNASALSNTANGGNVRITLGTTTYQGNEFSSIISAGGLGSALPVEFGSITATVIESTVTLNWTTLSELNADYFDICVGTNLENFETEGFVAATGESSNILDYDFSFESTHSGILYIKIKQVDFDGGFTESIIVTIRVENQELSSEGIYPNPCENDLIINANASDVKITDCHGHAQKVIKRFDHILDTSSYPNGTYYIFINGDTKRFIVQH